MIFDGNGADSGSMESVTLPCGVEVTLPPCKFERKWNHFSYWTTTKEYSPVRYEDEGKISDLAEPGGTVTLYAHYTENRRIVHFDANGGEGVMGAIKGF